MQKRTTNVTSTSIKSSGLPQEFRYAIAQYIWNGFDANASEIEINYTVDTFSYIQSLSVMDNGDGIPVDTLGMSFGSFMDSMKSKSFNLASFVKGKKGKGRFSFEQFAGKATWHTVFQSEGNYLEYNINVKKDEMNFHEVSDHTVSKKTETGTTVSFSGFEDLAEEHINSDLFENYLCAEFGWFLLLNADKKYSIKINGSVLPYNKIIVDDEKTHIDIDGCIFDVHFVRWDQKISDKYYYYFLDAKKAPVERKHTSFNNKGNEFHHSLYVKSPYFDDFHTTGESEDQTSLGFDGKNQSDPIFKQLLGELNAYVNDKQRAYLRHNEASKLITKINKKNLIPEFKDNTYDQLRKKDLENVVIEIYCAEPKVFQGVNDKATKTIVSFLNLLLDSDERENVMIVMDQLVKMTTEDRVALRKTLKRTTLTHITNMVKMLEGRFHAVDVLKTIIFDLTRFANERDHVQKIVENNYWIFGEEFHRISADQSLEVMLNNYLAYLESGNKLDNKVIIDTRDKLKRPDLFLCGNHEVPNPDGDHPLEENLVVELKRPSVVIGKEQLDQIEGYMEFIINEPRFNSELRKWKFYIIGKELDSWITRRHESWKIKGKKFLVQDADNYEIYALRWSDIFTMFKSRHKFMIDKLQYKDTVVEELKANGVNFDCDTADDLTDQVKGGVN